MRDIINEIVVSMSRNKLRTALTGFAVAWGIFMLIFLLGAGNGLINAQVNNTKGYLANSMVVYGGFTSMPYDGLESGRRVNLTDRDIDVTGRGFTENIDMVGAVISQGGQTVTFGKEYVNVTIDGVYPGNILINKREMLVGRFINDMDMSERRKVMVISEEHAKELVPRAPHTLAGKYVRCGGLVYRIVGIYKSDAMWHSTSAFVPFTTLRTVYDKGSSAGNIEFSFHGLATQADNECFEDAYKARLNKLHRAAPEDNSAIWIGNRYTSNMQMNNGISMMRTALWIVGLLTLLSGVVGVSNIMLITVKERRREFGIRKAIGATPWQILRLIIVESVVVTTFFGYIGMVCGVAANEILNATIGNMVIDTGIFKMLVFLDPTVGLDVCVEATLVMIAAGTVAGLIPARKAARIRPIEALRAE